jgi:hypothetical protein
MRAILYYVDGPRPIELHGLERIIYDELSVAEAQTLMRLPAARTPGAELSRVEFRGRVFNCHEDNRVLIYNRWGITDVYVAERRHPVTMLIPAEDVATLTESSRTDA